MLRTVARITSRAACALTLFLASAESVAASPIVVQRAVGTITGVTTEPAGATPPFAVGQPVVLTWSTDVGSQPLMSTLHSWYYLDAIVDLRCACGPVSLRLGVGGLNRIAVSDDVLLPTGMVDGYQADIAALFVDSPGGVAASGLRFGFTATSGGASWSIGEIPFDLQGSFAFAAPPAITSGTVSVALDSPTVPALPGTWGRIKARYR